MRRRGADAVVQKRASREGRILDRSSPSSRQSRSDLEQLNGWGSCNIGAVRHLRPNWAARHARAIRSMLFAQFSPPCLGWLSTREAQADQRRKCGLSAATATYTAMQHAQLRLRLVIKTTAALSAPGSHQSHTRHSTTYFLEWNIDAFSEAHCCICAGYSLPS